MTDKLTLKGVTNVTELTEEKLQQYYIELDSYRFDLLCLKTSIKLEKFNNKFVEDVLTSCKKTRKITYKQFKVLILFVKNVVPEYRDFN